MTSNSPLSLALINAAAAAAVPLLTRQSLTPLSQTPFLRPPELFWQALAGSGSDSWLAHLAEARAA